MCLPAAIAFSSTPTRWCVAAASKNTVKAGSASAASRSVVQSGDVVIARHRGDAFGIAADQQQARHDAVVADRKPALVADRRQRIRKCWVEPMRPVAPLTMMPIVRVAMLSSAMRRGGEGAAAQLCYAGRLASTLRESVVPRHIVCLTFDFDTQSGFIARGMTTPTPLSRGEFGLVGARRILALAQGERHPRDLVHPRASPSRATRLRGGGRGRPRGRPPQLGAYSAGAADRAEEEADLVRANEAIARLTGRKARGYRSPSWDLSEHTIDLLLAHGFLYDSSLMGADYWPYRARRGDRAELGKPFNSARRPR